MITVCIESPLAGDFERNINYARLALRHCLDAGVSPFASHLLYTQVLNDQAPGHRKLGMKAGFELGDRCDVRWFFTDFGWSNGMRAALERNGRLSSQAYLEVTLGVAAHELRDLAIETGTPYIVAPTRDPRVRVP